MKRILFFSPYTPWTPHTMWEVTMAYALRQRGHITHFVTCGGLPDCGMEPARRGHTEATCANCRAVSDILANRLRHKPEFMQSALTETEPGQIAAWAQSLPSEDLRAACYEGLPLGRWTWPDMVGYWHSLEPGLDRPDVEQSYRHLLYGAAVAATALPRIYDRFCPDILVTLNGGFFLQRVAFEMARARGIRCVVHERGWRDNTAIFHVDGLVNDIDRFERYWAAWKEVPLTQEELQATHELLLQRRQGVNMNWSAYSPSEKEAQSADLPAAGPMALLCTSSDCESSLVDRAPRFYQYEWIERTVRWFHAHPQYALVIRVHPNELEHSRVDDRPLNRYRALKAQQDANIRVILPDEKVNTYALMDRASAGLTYGSTAGLEMACLGVPLIHAGHGMYRDAGFTYEVCDLSELPSLLAAAMRRPRSVETQRLAYRFLYRTYFGLCVPFTKVKVSRDYYAAELNYSSTAELAPGRDRQLDAIAEYILGESDLYPGPTEEQCARTAEAEEAFSNSRNQWSVISDQWSEEFGFSNH